MWLSTEFVIGGAKLLIELVMGCWPLYCGNSFELSVLLLAIDELARSAAEMGGFEFVLFYYPDDGGGC